MSRNAMNKAFRDCNKKKSMKKENLQFQTMKMAMLICVILLGINTNAYNQCDEVAPTPSGANQQSRGMQDMLVIHVDWPDDPITEPLDMKEKQEEAQKLDQWFREQSSCRIGIDFTIIDHYIRMPYKKSEAGDYVSQMAHALEIAQEIDSNYKYYNYTVFMYGAINLGAAGRGGPGKAWANFGDNRVARHEIAHVHGVNHEDVPEGDIGNILTPFARFNADWISFSDTVGFAYGSFFIGEGTGDYRIYDYTSSQEVSNGLRLLRVRNFMFNNTDRIYLAYDGRTETNGVIVYKDDGNAKTTIERHDFTPDSKSGKLADYEDGNLKKGQSFYHDETDGKIEVIDEVAATATTPAYAVVRAVYTDDPNPEMVTLSDLYVKGYTMSPVFSAHATQYFVDVPEGTSTIPEVVATPSDKDASVNIEKAESLTGSSEQRSTTVRVTGKNGTEGKLIKVTFQVPVNTDAALSYLDPGTGLLDPSFDMAKTSYSVDAGASPSGSSSVTALTADDEANVKIDQASDMAGMLEERTATVTVTAADGVTKKVYTIVFYATPDNGKDAYLTTISLSNGNLLTPDFTNTNFDYTVYLTKGSDIPTVNGLTSDMSATKDVTQATSLSGSEKDRTATIVVTSKDKSVTNTYTVVFSTQTVTLSEKQLDGEITMSPNPVTDMLYFSGMKNINNIMVWDASGRIVINKRGHNMQYIDLSFINPGLYFISFSSPDNTITKKIIKQ